MSINEKNQALPGIILPTIFNASIFPNWLGRMDLGPEADIDDRIRFR
jgi:hypothetical protein